MNVESMTLDASLLLFLGIGYLALLFVCGTAAERGWIPVRLLRHPIVYTLALGVYASAWAFYGSLELAAHAGFGYLAYYLGAAGAFLLAPVLWCLFSVLPVPISLRRWPTCLRFAFVRAGWVHW